MQLPRGGLPPAAAAGINSDEARDFQGVFNFLSLVTRNTEPEWQQSAHALDGLPYLKKLARKALIDIVQCL